MTEASDRRIAAQIADLREQGWSRVILAIVLLLLGGVPLLLIGINIPPGPEGLTLAFVFITYVPIAAIFGIISLVMLLLGLTNLADLAALKRKVRAVTE